MRRQPQQEWLVVLPLLGLLFAIVVAPCFFTTALRDIFVMSKTIPLAVGVTLIWLGLAVTGCMRRKLRLELPIKAFAAAALLSACLSVDRPLSILGPHEQQFYALVPMALVILAYLAGACLEDLPSTVFVFGAILGGVLVAVPAIIQVTLHRFMAWTIQGGRAGSTFGSPIFLGPYLAMVAPLILAWGRGRERWARALLWAAFVVIILGLLATKSRGSIAAAFCGMLVAEVFFDDRSEWSIIMLGSVGAAALILGIMLRGRATGSDLGHLEIWKIALMAWRAHPVFGWGPDTFALAYRQFLTPAAIAAEGSDQIIQLSAHNDVLQVMSTMGLVGLAAYAYLLVGVGRTVLDAFELGEPEAPLIAGALVSLFVQAKVGTIPLTVLVIAALLVGSLDRRLESEDDERVFTMPSIAAGCSLLLLGVFLVMCRAERFQRLGENFRTTGHALESAQQFNLAAQVNPFDLWYTQRQLDYFWQIAPVLVSQGTSKLALAAFSHDLSERIGRLHPNDPTAHELRALSWQFEGAMIGRSRAWEAANEMMVAARLAPHFSTYEQRFVELAAQAKEDAPTR